MPTIATVFAAAMVGPARLHFQTGKPRIKLLCPMKTGVKTCTVNRLRLQ